MTAPLKSSFRTIGMLGGMGPAATALTFEYIIRQTRASKDDEHIPMLIYNLPQIPDRTAAILGEGLTSASDFARITNFATWDG